LQTVRAKPAATPLCLAQQGFAVIAAVHRTFFLPTILAPSGITLALAAILTG
jgi:hypothetical protein